MISTETPCATTGSPPTGWRPSTRIAFRFCVVYFGSFCLLPTLIPFALLGILGRWVRGVGGRWTVSPADPIPGWIGSTVFGVDAVLHQDSGAGDQTANWVLVFCLLVVAVVAAAGWTLVDRHTSHPRLSAWFTLFLRLCLGGQMLGFGLAKLIPTQMPGPTLAQLLQPYGDLSPASVLWLQVGSSHPYEMALGAAEVAAELLSHGAATALHSGPQGSPDQQEKPGPRNSRPPSTIDSGSGSSTGLEVPVWPPTVGGRTGPASVSR